MTLRCPLARQLAGCRPLYALLDAARDPDIRPLLEGSGCHHDSLFENGRAEHLAEFAPYLVSIDPVRPLLDTLVSHWSDHWGAYLTTPAARPDLLGHLRRLLWAETPDGVMLWRFYDPRVLRDVLPTCDARRAAAFFGPVHAFICAAADPRTLLYCTAGTQGVVIETCPVGSPIPHRTPA